MQMVMDKLCRSRNNLCSVYEYFEVLITIFLHASCLLDGGTLVRAATELADMRENMHSYRVHVCFNTESAI